MVTKKVAVMVAVAFVALGAGEAFAAGKKSSKKMVTGVVNLNTATQAQLDLLPGVGEKSAKAIVEYRKAAAFTRAEDLVKVKGFGRKSYEKLKGHLAVTGPTTLQVTKAPALPAGEAPAQGRAAPPKR